VTRELRAQETTKTQERSMKKVLLTTTALVMTAGVAAAEVSISGKTQVNITATGNGDNVLNTHADINMALSGSYDNGMTMSTSFGVDLGREADYNDDFQLDDAEGGAQTSAPNMTIGYAGYTFTADGQELDNLYDDGNTTGNFGVAGTMGGIDFALTTNIDGNASEQSYKLSYAVGDITATATGTNDHGANSVDATKFVVGYKMGDTTFTLTSDDGDDTTEAVRKIGVSTKIDAITLTYVAASNGDANSSIGDDWDATVAYSAGALGASYTVDEDDRSRIVVDYDLGGGAAAFATMQAGAANDGSEDFTAMGINFSF
jgi:outer membrane protein OmpU